ncbi:unnamed protein product [Leptosia nina]|uniref:Large ribosomal subunit protein bL34m n=1 Tax=Leptosia nina TaxID=320188 RepID=A0AAV1IZF1_9NEOP
MSRLLAAVFQPLRQGFSFTQPVFNSLVRPETSLLSLIRTKVRCYFPRPNEVRRVRRHGWEFRMSSHNGRRTLMRRILKGRHVISH